MLCQSPETQCSFFPIWIFFPAPNYFLFPIKCIQNFETMFPDMGNLPACDACSQNIPPNPYYKACCLRLNWNTYIKYTRKQYPVYSMRLSCSSYIFYKIMKYFSPNKLQHFNLCKMHDLMTTYKLYNIQQMEPFTKLTGLFKRHCSLCW